VAWSGRCPPEQQKELMPYLEQLAARSEERINLLPGRKEGSGKRPVIERFDCAISECMNLDLNIFEHSEGFERFAAETDLSITETAGRAKKDGLFVLNLFAPRTNYLVRLEGASIYGISFQVYGVMYPEEDRVSFIFLNHPEIPFVDGHTVDIYHRTKSPALVNFDTINADWYVCRPDIHLRYHLEEWFDHFLSWIKYFFVRDLYYWRYEPLAGYDRYKEWFDLLESKVGRSLAKQASFEEVLENFAPSTAAHPSRMRNRQPNGSKDQPVSGRVLRVLRESGDDDIDN
jgi:hypothetical protein